MNIAAFTLLQNCVTLNGYCCIALTLLRTQYAQDRISGFSYKGLQGAVFKAIHNPITHPTTHPLPQTYTQIKSDIR